MNDEKVEIKKDSSKDLLWHFTSCEAMTKILLGEDGLLVGSSVFMNDVEDCSLSRQLLQATIPLQQTIAMAIGRGTVPQKLAQQYFSSGMAMPTFTLSFTESVYNPVMWQVHTKTGGVAIGFDRFLLEAAVTKQPDPCFDIYVKKCNYKKYAHYLSEVEAIGNELENLPTSSGRINSKKIKEYMQLVKDSWNLASKLIFVKKASFSWEEEIRIAYVRKNGCHLGDRLRIINGKPFVTMKLPSGSRISELVKEIRISPFGDVAKTRTTAFMVGESINLNPRKIKDWDFD